MTRIIMLFIVVVLVFGCASETPSRQAEQPKPAQPSTGETSEKPSSEPMPDTIFSAAAKGQLATVMRKLEEGEDINTTDKTGMTALSWAALRGRGGVVRYLLEKNADPNIPDEKGLYPIHKACLFGDKSVVQSLIDFDADVNAAGPGGLKAVEIARRMKHADIVSLLEAAAEKAGADAPVDPDL